LYYNERQACGHHIRFSVFCRSSKTKFYDKEISVAANAMLLDTTARFIIYFGAFCLPIWRSSELQYTGYPRTYKLIVAK
jgi:hypothetical protein